MPIIASSSPVPGTASLGATGSSALVVEYICLFTRDLRRKQKRWQDGRLKYHTFNKRVMVYDDRGNFIGDTHWRADEDLDAGEELELERGGAIVQVSDCVGQQAQDLSELLDKRLQEKEQRHANAAARTPAPALPRRPDPRSQPPPDPYQPLHRPLKDLIGTPTGHHGRAAVTADSPFEQRHKVASPSGQHDEERPGKRRKRDNTPPSKMGYARSLFGTTLSLSGAPASSAPLRCPVPERQPRVLPLPGSSSSSVGGLPGVDERAPPEPQAVVATRHRSPSIESTTVVHHAPPSKRTTRLGGNTRVFRDSPVQSGEDIASSQGIARRDTAHNPLMEVPNQAVPDRRTPSTKTAKRAKTSANALQLSKPPSQEKTAKSSSRVQKKARRTSAAPAPLVIEPTSVEIIEIDDDAPGTDELERRISGTPVPPASRRVPAEIIEIESEAQARNSVERTTTRGADPKTELRLKSRRKRGLLVVAEQGTSASGNKGTTQPRISCQDRSGRRSRPLSAESSGLGSDIENGELEAQQHPAGSPLDVVDTDKPFLDHCSYPAVRRQDVPDAAKCSEKPVIGAPRKKTREPRKARKTNPAGIGGDLSSHGEETAPHDDVYEPPVAPAPAKPRLVKLARKSVKSKELIGFVMKDADVSDQLKRSALIRAHSRFQETPEECSRQFGAVTMDPSAGTDTSAPGAEESREESPRIGGPPAELAPESRPLSPNRHKSAAERPTPESLPLSPNRHESAAEKSTPDARIDSLSKNNHAGAVNPQSDGHESYQPSDHQPSHPRAPTPELAQPTATSPGDVDGWIVEQRSMRRIANPTKDEPHPPRQLERKSSEGHAPAAPRSDPTDSSDQVPVVSGAQSRQTRLANPATRGRKAALRSHAAGQAPQSFLPPDLGAVAGLGSRPVGDGTGVPRAGSSEAPRVGSSEIPRIKMKFPGFTSANASGPWSREAHDLFATGRPG